MAAKRQYAVWPTAKVISKGHNCILFIYLLLKYSGMLLTFLKNLTLCSFNNQTLCLPLYLLIYISNYSKFPSKTAEFLCNYLCLQQQELLQGKHESCLKPPGYFLSHGHNPNPEDKKVSSMNRKTKRKQYSSSCLTKILGLDKCCD